MANSTDPYQEPTDLDLHCLEIRAYPGTAGPGLKALDCEVRILDHNVTGSFLVKINNIPVYVNTHYALRKYSVM